MRNYNSDIYIWCNSSQKNRFTCCVQKYASWRYEVPPKLYFCSEAQCEHWDLEHRLIMPDKLIQQQSEPTSYNTETPIILGGMKTARIRNRVVLCCEGGRECVCWCVGTSDFHTFYKMKRKVSAFPVVFCVRLESRQNNCHPEWSEEPWPWWPLGLCDQAAARTVRSSQRSPIFTWDHDLKGKKGRFPPNS